MLILCSKFGKTKVSPYICHIEIRNQLNNKDMKTNYKVTVYSEFTKRNRTIKLYQMDFGQLAEWVKTFEQTKGLVIKKIINTTI